MKIVRLYVGKDVVKTIHKTTTLGSVVRRSLIEALRNGVTVAGVVVSSQVDRGQYSRVAVSNGWETESKSNFCVEGGNELGNGLSIWTIKLGTLTDLVNVAFYSYLFNDSIEHELSIFDKADIAEIRRRVKADSLGGFRLC